MLGLQPGDRRRASRLVFFIFVDVIKKDEHFYFFSSNIFSAWNKLT